MKPPDILGADHWNRGGGHKRPGQSDREAKIFAKRSLQSRARRARALLQLRAQQVGSTKAPANGLDRAVQGFYFLRVLTETDRPMLLRALAGNFSAARAGRRILSSQSSDAYSQSDVNAPMMPVYKELVASGAIDIMVYSGDDDAICATAGSQRWIWSMGYNNTEAWRPLLYPAGQTAGFTTYFQDDSATSKGGGFRFTTVHGAGHMVPQTRPSQSLEVLRRFLDNQWH